MTDSPRGAPGGTTSGEAFLPLDPKRLAPGEQVPFALYVREGDRFVLYRGAALALDGDELRRLELRGHGCFYVEASARRAMARYLAVRLSDELRDPARSLDEKATFLVEASQVIMEELFASPEAPESLSAVRQVARQTVELLAEGRQVFRRLLRLVNHDYYSYTHSLQVGVYAIAMGRQMGLSPEFQRKLGEGALVHDVGKALVPPEILAKPTPLSADEWQVMKQHPQLGIDLLGASGPLDEVTRWAILGHHERVDGRGYPYGLKGDEIGLPGRIVALCDIYDSLVTHRPYKPALRSYDALNAIKDHMLEGVDRHLFRELVVLLARGDDEW